MEPLISLDQRYQPTIYSYDRGNGHKNVVLQGIAPQMKSSYSISVDSMASKYQTVVLEQGIEWEIVLELRPRRLTQLERTKLCNAR